MHATILEVEILVRIVIEHILYLYSNVMNHNRELQLKRVALFSYV